MTHAEINHAIEILNAIKDGKEICDADGRGMSLDLLMAVRELNTVAISENMNNLRIKPERKFVSWTWRDLDIIQGMEIFPKEPSDTRRPCIIRYCGKDDLMATYFRDEEFHTYEYIFENYVQKDGSPCGKEIEG